MDNLEEIVKDLEKILSNFEKSKHRGYTEKTLNEKETSVDTLLAKAESLKPVSTTLENVNKVSEAFKKVTELGNQIRKLIRDQRESPTSETKMTFDIKMATALVATYNGKEEDTESFLESITLLDELTQAADKEIMLKFIKTRITGKAKYAISANIATLDALKTKLQQKFSTRLSSDAILAQLKSTQQSNKKLPDFISQIEGLAGQLTRAFIVENVATGESAEKLAEKFAMQALIENIANPETSLILKAATYTKLSDLAAKAILVDKPTKANVFHYKSTPNKNQNRYQGNNRQSNYNGSRWGKPNNWQQHENHTQKHKEGTQYTGNRYNNGQSYNNWQYNANRNNQNRNAFNTNQNRSGNQRIHCCNAGECEPPQQDADPSQLGGPEQIGEFST